MGYQGNGNRTKKNFGPKGPTWKQKLTQDPRVVEVNSERAREARVERDTTFRQIINNAMNAMNAMVAVYVSLTSFTAPFVKNAVKQVFFNWGPWDDNHTQLWQEYQETTQKDGWYNNYPNVHKTDGKDQQNVFTDDSKYFHGKRLSVLALCGVGKSADGKNPPHRTPDFFKEIARDAFFIWQSKTDLCVLTSKEWRERYLCV